MKKEICLDIKGEKVRLHAHDKDSIAYTEWLVGQNFKDMIVDTISEIRKKEGIKK